MTPGFEDTFNSVSNICRKTGGEWKCWFGKPTTRSKSRSARNASRTCVQVFSRGLVLICITVGTITYHSQNPTMSGRLVKSLLQVLYPSVRGSRSVPTRHLPGQFCSAMSELVQELRGQARRPASQDFTWLPTAMLLSKFQSISQPLAGSGVASPDESKCHFIRPCKSERFAVDGTRRNHGFLTTLLSQEDTVRAKSVRLFL